jgi:DeoR/GlpR family transcriptional regulator of sugar metabolism
MTRHKQIIDALSDQKLTVNDLCRLLKVSRETVARTLMDLENQGKVASQRQPRTTGNGSNPKLYWIKESATL